MRIALNTSILRAPRTGIGQYIAGLSAELREQSDLQLECFSGLTWRRELPPTALPGYSKLSAIAKRFLPDAYRLRRSLQQHRFNEGCRRLRPDLYHEPSLWPFEFDGPMVMTLHDLTHVHFPHTQPADRLREIERHVHRGLEYASRILVDSHFVAEEVKLHYGLAADKLVVAPLGCAPRFRPRSPQAIQHTLQSLGLVSGQYLLCVGTLEPRKNLQLALDAYMTLPEAIRSRFPLLIAGMAGWCNEQLQAPLQRALASGQVRLVGYQGDEALAELLAGARLLLFPSLYEGFGLPVLEAMASGTPVVLSHRASLPELAGEAAVYIEPDDPSGCAQAMLSLIDDQHHWQQLRVAGLARAEHFSWRRCAEITAATYREAVSA